MPILALFTGTITRSQYDLLRKEVDWEHDKPAGAIFHVASFDDAAGQIHVADVWASAEELNAFAQSRLMPAFAHLELSPPTVAVFPAHNLQAYEAVSQYRI